MGSLMKRIASAIIIACALVIAASSNCRAAWHHEVVGRGEFIALTVGPDSVTHYLYETVFGMQEGKIRHLAFDSRGRQIFREDLPSIGFASEVRGDIAVDPQKRLHVVLSEIGEESPVTYAFFDGTAWNIQEIPNSALRCGWPTLALDPGDHPHVGCFLIDAPPPGFHHYSFDGANWDDELVPVSFGSDRLAPRETRTPIFITPGGTIHFGVAVSDVSNGGQIVACDSVKSSGTWTPSCGCARPDHGGFVVLTMGIDSAGFPRFMYPTEAGIGFVGVDYCAFDGTSFNAQTVSATASEGVLALDSRDTSKAVILEPKSPGSMTGRVTAEFGALNAGTWSFSKIGSAPAVTGPGLALGPDGLPRAGATALNFHAIYAFFTVR